MLSKSQIKVFSLVNSGQNERSFDKICQFVEESEYLRELDLSYAMTRPQIMIKLLRVIKKNRDLTCLNLGWNELIED